MEYLRSLDTLKEVKVDIILKDNAELYGVHSPWRISGS